MRLPNIVGIHGFAQTGKDTVAEHLVKEHGYERRAFADIMREGIYRLNPWVRVGSSQYASDFWRLQDLVDEIGWDEAKVKFSEVRRLLQVYGTECGRDLLGENIWVDSVLNQLTYPNRYVITDVRFENEAQALADLRPDAYLLKVVRPGTGPVNSHASDAGLDNHWFDSVVMNDDTIEALHTRVIEMLQVGR